MSKFLIRFFLSLYASLLCIFCMSASPVPTLIGQQNLARIEQTTPVILPENRVLIQKSSSSLPEKEKQTVEPTIFEEEETEDDELTSLRKQLKKHRYFTSDFSARSLYYFFFHYNKSLSFYKHISNKQYCLYLTFQVFRL